MSEFLSNIDSEFYRRVLKGDFPTAHSPTTLIAAGMNEALCLSLFDSQVKSRHLDLQARVLKEDGLGFYTIGSSGHEGNAVIANVFRKTDMAFLHYRSGAFYLERAKKDNDVDGVEDILLSLMTKASEPISAGRHKVFGRVSLFIPPQTSTIASHLPKAVGMAFSLSRAKELKIHTELPYDAVILCSFGDASVNHASAQTSFNLASYLAFQNYPLPMVFICEDNGLGISVPTPKDWIEHSMRQRPGIQYLQCDGLNLADIYEKACLAEKMARSQKKPVFLHMKTVRLMGHAGADIELTYRSKQEIASTEADDPLLHSARILVEQTGFSPKEVVDHYNQVALAIVRKLKTLKTRACLNSKEAVKHSVYPALNRKALKPASEPKRQEVFAHAYPQLQQKRILSSLLNFALTDLMLQYPQMVLMGEDVGKKGGVYHVTAELQERFGKRRVFDSPLDETTILGTSIGMAQNGFIPVPEIQFLAYVHNAEDQIRGEAATLSFFSNGQYQNPMVIRIPGFAYQKGFGGHFHNDNSIAVFRDIPGLTVACPSNGVDAVRMLRTLMAMAYQTGNISVFLEPIALYGTKDLNELGDGLWMGQYPALEESIALGEVASVGDGEIHVISFANGYYLARQAQHELASKHQMAIKVIDLRWLVPLPMKSLIKALEGAKAILIVDETRSSGSVSEGLTTLLLEQMPECPIKRLTAEDCFIPLGPAMQLMLPSKDQIIETVMKMSLGLR